MFVSSDRTRLAPGSETPTSTDAGSRSPGRCSTCRRINVLWRMGSSSSECSSQRPRWVSPGWIPAPIDLAGTVSADQQHELPAHVALLAHPVRLGNLGEREGLRDREREAPGLDQLADLGERVDRAASVPAAEPHPMLLRATEVGDRHDVLRAACEPDELGQDAAPRDVE